MLLMADLHHLPRSEGAASAAELLARFDLVEGREEALPSATPAVMKRRLDLAMTLVGDPADSSSSTSRPPASTRAAASTMWGIIRELVAGWCHRLPHTPVPGRGRPNSPTASPVLSDAGSPPRASAEEAEAARPGRPRTAAVRRPGRVPVRRRRPARGHPRRGVPRAPDPQDDGSQRELRAHPRLAGLGLHRGGRN